ncbi:glycosyltransferase family 4 protein [Candidatus Gottesmanbacteria bacterium]|nr:glycosyltransferase family 4 protein [Candidatus Gottesmanbacteria bacterium]
MKRLRIAVAGILNKPIQQNSIGGTEVFTYQLIEGLVKKGHHVILFATSDSKTSADKISVCSSKDIRGIVEGGIETRFPYHLLQSRNIIDKSNKFDIIHNNYFDSFLFTAFSEWLKCPLITTAHNDFWQFPHLSKILKSFHRHKRDGLIFVSEKARELAKYPPDSFTIYNGIDANTYKFDSVGGDYGLWLSRMVPHKGAKEAVEVANKANIKLKLNHYSTIKPEYTQYYQEHVKKFLNKKIMIVYNDDLPSKINLYQKAKVFLFPVMWEEPFGYVLIEAMACGTPVVAYAKGATPEVIEDGVTGFLVNPSDNDKRGNWIVKQSGITGLVKAINIIKQMSQTNYINMRKKCRERVEKYFTIDRMVDQYLELYNKLILDYKPI